MKGDGQIVRGRFADVCRVFLGAYLFLARMTRHELLFALISLARRTTSWGVEEDQRLQHFVGFVKGSTSTGLYLNVVFDDVITLHIHVDSDHAVCPFSRRSTSGAAEVIRGPKGTNVLIDGTTKPQVIAEISSGGAETIAVEQEFVADAIDLETVRVIQAEYPSLRLGSFFLRRTCIPTLVFLEDIDMKIEECVLHIDATVAISALKGSYHGILFYLNKTHGVNLSALGDLIRKLGIRIVKEPSLTNDADMYTKGLNGREIREKCSRLGIM